MLPNFLCPRRVSFILIFAFLIVGSIVVNGTQPVTWTTNSRAELLKGDARGVSISDTGAITLAPKLDAVYNTEQPYVWSSTVDATGNLYLGTGHDGKVFKVTPDGHGSLFYDSPELDVTALAVGADGAIYAGTSPDGKVYRIAPDGKAEVYFDPPDKYIWALAFMRDGSLAIGTGDNGKLYRVKTKDAKPEDSLLAKTTATHVISLAVDARGNLIAGTDPGGVVLRVSPDGSVFALFDSSLREIHAIAPAQDGSVYVLGLSESAAGGRAGAAPSTASTTESSTSGTPTLTLSTIDEATGNGGTSSQLVKSRQDLSNAKSAVWHIMPDGGTDVLWNSSSVTAFSIAANPSGNGVLIGTSDKGRIYSVTNEGRDTLLLQTPEGQISGLLARGSDVYATSSNQGKLFHFGSTPISEGSFESVVRDAKQVSEWGRIWWRTLGRVEVQTRTGNSTGPDSTWSAWSAAYTNSEGTRIESPKARFIQWRAVLHQGGTAAGPRMEAVSLAYLPRNVAPEILNITFLPPGVGLQPALQVPPDPNIETSGLDPALFGMQSQVPPRKVYQRGARSIQWQAEDRNGDSMEYSLYYRAWNEIDFRLLKDKIREPFYTIDGSTLADGRYIFKIIVSDAPDNPDGLALSSERISEPVEIDNTPPDVHLVGDAKISGGRIQAVFDTSDATGRITRAEVSLDGGPWRPVYPEDGIADGPAERYSLSLTLAGTGEHTVSFRVFDSSGNAGSARVTVR